MSARQRVAACCPLGYRRCILPVTSILVVLLVVAGVFAAAPSASADKIVFTRLDRSQAGGLVVMRPSGRVVSVARGFVNNYYDVSLDGRRVVVSDEALLTTPFTNRDRLAVPRTRVLTRSNPGLWPQVSPNGRFVAGAKEAGGQFQVFVVRVPGGRARRLRTSAALSAPSWSPDGRRIVANGEGGLWVINVATGAAREIVSSEAGESFGPAWSPNGRWIAFIRTESTTGSGEPPLGSSQLWRARPDGSGQRQLTHLAGTDVIQRPAWSPDGRRLALITYRGGFSRPIATIRANGSGLRTLLTSGFNYGIDWTR
ncbi:MAG TPA: LpqB family beta-propeller domain-containing protein [Solirubrobacterales bacterium]|nr:LpqB family beta-propeller domain-containing protein [Solirubrobacterales bacterium]